MTEKFLFQLSILDDEGNTDYALNTTGRFIYTVVNSNSPDTFAEGLLSVTFNPVSPIVEYKGVSTGIQQLNFEEDTTFDLNVKFENVGVFGSIFVKDLTNDFTLSYTANGVVKQAAYSFSGGNTGTFTRLQAKMFFYWIKMIWVR